MKWTDDADAILIKLWTAGGSLSSVANGLCKAGYSVNRSKVSGRVHRLRKWGRLLFERMTPKPEPKPKPPPKLRRSKRMTEPKPKPPGFYHRAPDIDVLIDNPGVEYLDNPSDGCKALLDKRSGDWNLQMCCGLPRGYDHNGNKSSYCYHHLEIYINPQGRR